MFPTEGIPLGVHVSVSVTSYVTPWANLSGVDEIARECLSFRVPNAAFDDSYADVSLRSEPPLAVSYETRRVTMSTNETIAGSTVGRDTRLYVALAGHNVVTVQMLWDHDPTAPPQDTVDRLDRMATDTLRTVVAAL